MKPSLKSLVGHASAVSSVAFDSSEEFIAAGSARGVLKVWDLEQAKGFSFLFSPFHSSSRCCGAQS
jgi:WD40 repeat protein